jgi:CDP-diacylglycerol---serine O-phosphatidyltransferase
MMLIESKILDLKLYLADVSSFMNLLAGLVSIYFSLHENYTAAIICIGIAVIFDALDGALARALRRESLLGMQLDSFSDFISFSVAVSILLNMKFIFIPSIMIPGVIFICAGAFRLARYNVLHIKNPNMTEYIGTPITWNGLLFPVLFIWGVPGIIFTIMLLVMSLLMVSTIRIKRPF